MSRPLSPGLSAMLFSVKGSGPDSLSTTSPEKATSVAIGYPQRNWVGKSCTATIKSVTHAPQGRRGRTQYTLLGVHPPRAPGE